MNSERPCPVCRATQTTLFMREHIRPEAVTSFSYASRKEPEYMCHELVRCSHCQLVYAIRPPSTGVLAEAYGAASYDSGEEALCAAESYAKALAPQLKNIPRGLAVDVGAGNGALLPFFQEMGFSVVLGIEPSRSAIRSAPIEIKNLLREEMFSPDSLGGKKASLICSFMTLEHLPDPGEFVHTAFDSLEAGGMLAVVVHNYEGLLNRLLGRRSPIIDIEHLQLFCPQAATTLFSKTGFRDIHVQPLYNCYPLRYWLRLAPLPVSIKKILLERAFKKSWFGAICAQKIGANVGNIMITGKK